MVSTYTDQNGVELQADGENSGTWGDRTNVGIQIMERAISGVGIIDLSAAGAAYTLTTTDATLSEGQYGVLILSGATQTCTVTISPNDQTKIFMCNNTGSFSVIMKQGSGNTVTIVAGKSKVVYADGAGTTASVTDFTDVLEMSNVKITGGSISGVTDISIADGGTGSSTAPAAATALGVGTGNSPQFTGINVGHASDSTISRVSAGVISVGGVTIPTLTSTSTLTNKTLTSPTLTSPNLGTPTTLVGTNITGTASGLTAGNVTTNANLTGGVTSVGNTATVVTNANLTGDVTSSGNATTIGAGKVTVPMLAVGTDGELITWSATGSPTTVAVGTANQVLTSNGLGTAPTFQNAASGGIVLQKVYYETSAVQYNTSGTGIPSDNTIPQKTEGNLYFSQSITPTSAASTLVVEVEAHLATSASGWWVTGSIFLDAGADALSTTNFPGTTNDAPYLIRVRYKMAAGSTAAKTFKFIAGGSSGTSPNMTLNGAGGTGRFGGAIISSMTITEYQ